MQITKKEVLNETEHRWVIYWKQPNTTPHKHKMKMRHWTKLDPNGPNRDLNDYVLNPS